jgi:hypothetical protein
VAEQHAAVVEQHVVAAEELAAAAGIGDRSFVMFLVDREIWKWREAICSERC